MSGFLKSLFGLLNRDVTGRTWTEEKSHPYFGTVTYFGSKDPAQCYWEAEISTPELSKPIGVTMAGTPAGPTLNEESFCRETLADLDAVFERCRISFEPVFLAWAKRPLPAEWRDCFNLDGFKIPKDGEASNPWEISYFVESTGHFFIAQFENERVQNVAVDG